jgi:putative ABC transport system substrate-binding protein
VAVGLVASLNRPGGNATGVTLFAVALGQKKVELLHEMIPKLRKIAFLVNPNNQTTIEVESPGVHSAAHHLGLELIVLSASTESEIESSFEAAAKQNAAGVYIGSDAFLVGQREQIAALGLRHRLAIISPTRNEVIAGELMSYGPSQSDMYRQVGIYVGRILKGEKPGELPVLQPSKFELVINLKTANALGLTIPPALLARADEVIE